MKRCLWRKSLRLCGRDDVSRQERPYHVSPCPSSGPKLCTSEVSFRYCSHAKIYQVYISYRFWSKSIFKVNSCSVWQPRQNTSLSALTISCPLDNKKYTLFASQKRTNHDLHLEPSLLHSPHVFFHRLLCPCHRTSPSLGKCVCVCVSGPFLSRLIGKVTSCTLHCHLSVFSPSLTTHPKECVESVFHQLRSTLQRQSRRIWIRCAMVRSQSTLVGRSSTLQPRWCHFPF